MTKSEDEKTAIHEAEPLLASNRVESTEAQDAALAMRIGELEARRYRAEENEANTRAWEAHYRLMNILRHNNDNLLTFSQICAFNSPV